GRREIEGLIGFFVNTLALRLDLSGAPTVGELLERVRERALEAQQNQDIPFEQVVEAVRPGRSLAHSPLFQVMFAWQNAPRERMELPGLTLAGVAAGAQQPSAKYDLSLSLAETDGRIAGSVTYARSLYDGATVERQVGYLRRVLEEMAAGPERPVAGLEMLPEAERRQVVEGWNATRAAYPLDLCVHELFERQVERTPGAAAVVLDGGALTYAELDARARRLARSLAECGVGPESAVGLCAEPGAGMLVGVLGCWKAGGTFVPLDPAHPRERLAVLLQDAAAAVVLVEPHLADVLPPHGGRTLLLGAEEPGDGAGEAELPAPTPAPLARGTAYVIYTSGSSGRPKGVAVEHRSLANTLLGSLEAFGFGPADVVPALASFAFDIWLFETFCALLSGGAVRPVARDRVREVETLPRVLHDATVLHAVPALMRLVVDAVPAQGGGVLPRLRRLFVGGDAVPPELLREMRETFPAAEVHVLYGPTEGTVICAAHSALGEEPGRRMLGRPLGNVRLYVCDDSGAPVPVGVPGELWIGGPGVARGYAGQAEPTAERFVPDAFGGEAGARLYRTGDLVRRLPEGSLEFLGRTDRQVKVRGFRIEPGEVEARLRAHAGVREAVVVAREDTPGDRRLVAYWVGEALEAEALRAHLQERLPEHMVPAAYVRLEEMPLTPNGKVDRGALPAPDGTAYATGAYEPPAGETEEALAQIWSELLRVERVGRHDNFFELGGHSLLGVTLIERMRRVGLHADVRTVFASPTLADLAAAAGSESAEVEVPANGIPEGCEAIRPEMLPLVELTQAEINLVVEGVPGGAANVQDVYPLAPLQEGMLFHHLMAEEGDPYVLSSLLSFDSRERLEQYLAALQAVVDRHDILRTAIRWEGLRQPVQVVWRVARLRIDEVELDPADGDVGEQLHARFDARRHRRDIRGAPLIWIYVAPDPARNRWVALRQHHHLVADHTAAEVMQAEVQAHLLGRADELPEPLPFRNYVAQARLRMSREEHEAFFRELLGDVTETTAPFGLTDVRRDGSGVDEARLELDGPLAVRLRARARSLGVSAASLCHVAWAQVLARVSDRPDVVFGTVLLGRMQGGEGTDRVMGLFINTLPVRVKVGEAGAEASVRKTHALLAGLLRHEHASLALVQRCSGVEPPAPLFSALLNFRHSGRMARSGQAPAALGGIQGISTEERSSYPLTLAVDDLGDDFRITARSVAHVRAERVCAMVHTALERLVEALEVSPGRALGSIDVLPEAERRQVVEGWNTTEAEYPRELCVHQLFEAQARRSPDAVALVFAGEALSYAELNARANRLAHHLVGLGVGPEARVAVCVERSAEMVVALLAVLKAGGAFVPLDPEYPPERLGYMLRDSAPAAVLTQGPLLERLAAAKVPELAGVPVLDLAGDAAAWARRPESDPVRGALSPEHLVYVIYTSGSTG
ncbi:MAG TPA: amino acid adenylation domain-containing protein, partial [Longimicrobiaceae bacterium]|nr:amino acid adenylation domain-containing protein [Longimicrobiaceae bacterium]